MASAQSGQLARHFTMTQPAVSRHLRALRDAGLVLVRHDAQRRIYSLDGRGLAEIAHGSRAIAQCGLPAWMRSSARESTKIKTHEPSRDDY